MLAKIHKLHLKKELDFVYKNGNRLNSNSFSISFVKKDEIGSKFAVFAPKKIFKKAHDRNRAKRRLFELIRLNYEGFPDNINGIFFARSEMLDKEFPLLQKEIEEIVVKLKQVKN